MLAKVTLASWEVHPSHMFWAGVHYSAEGVAWGMTKAVKLAEPCRGRPALVGANVLKRISKGLPPTKKTKRARGADMSYLLVSCAP